MLKPLLTIIILFLGCGYAIVLLRQLNSTAQQLGKMRQDLAKSEAHLSDELKKIQDRQSAPEKLSDAPSSTRNDENS